MSDVCTQEFFESFAMRFDPDAKCRTFLTNNASSLAIHMQINYNKLPVMNGLPSSGLDAYVFSRYGFNLERIAEALFQLYNPLHNTDVEEKETNDGSDNHHYTGADTNRVQRAHSETKYEQTSNSALTSGSTYDDTVEANMKPISKTEHEFNTEQTTDTDGVSTLEFGKNLEMEYGREITKTKKGNIGVMPTQNLLQLEYYTRMRMTLFEAIVRACCNTFGCGVWGD